MNQNYKCVDFFPTWYKSIEPSPTAELVNKRLDGINAIIKLNDVDLWLDIVKIANGGNDYDETNAALLVSKFKNFDIAFPIISNDNIIKVLSQISLCFLFESGNRCSQCISMAVINSNFFEQNNTSEIPFCDFAVKKIVTKQFVEKEEIAEIEEQLLLKVNVGEVIAESELNEEEEEEEITISTEESLNLIKMVNYLNKENKKIKEETNVLWWLFGEYSTLNKGYFYDISVSKMVTASAQELIDLSTNTGYLNSARHILSKVIIITNKNKSKLKEITVAESILESSSETKERLILNGDLGKLTPLLYSVSLSKQTDQTAIWKSICNQKVGSDNLDKKFMPDEIAFQFYKEIIFLNLLQDLKNE